jgi:hypothetical protein
MATDAFSGYSPSNGSSTSNGSSNGYNSGPQPSYGQFSVPAPSQEAFRSPATGFDPYLSHDAAFSSQGMHDQRPEPAWQRNEPTANPFSVANGVPANLPPHPSTTLAGDGWGAAQPPVTSPEWPSAHNFASNPTAYDEASQEAARRGRHARIVDVRDRTAKDVDRLSFEEWLRSGA